MPTHKDGAKALFDLQGQDAGSPLPTAPSRQDDEAFVDQFMYLLTAPYVTWPGWEDIYQSNDNKTTALIQRMAHHREIFASKHCTEFEAMLYISTATLAHPPSPEWGHIYFWLFRRWNPEAAQAIEVDEVRELYPGEKELLARLRAWIFKVQMAHLKGKLQDAKDVAQ